MVFTKLFVDNIDESMRIQNFAHACNFTTHFKCKSTTLTELHIVCPLTSSLNGLSPESVKNHFEKVFALVIKSWAPVYFRKWVSMLSSSEMHLKMQYE